VHTALLISFSDIFFHGYIKGPVLERKGTALGVVSAIAGQTRIWVGINGTQGHAGTVPMKGR
jgi:allantoate deiminase